LAAICCGTPVVDACGAFVGRVEYVRTGQHGDDGDPPGGEQLRRGGFVKVCCEPGDRAFLVAAGQIAYVAEDHVRLSVTADRTLIVHPE
jgi:hypothetical protein